MLRQPLLLLARSDRVKKLVTHDAGLERHRVAATSPARPPRTPSTATGELVDDGLHVTLDFLGEDTLDREQADATVAAYLDVLERARRARAWPATPRSR